MRISDWSSDVCSSDLEGLDLQRLVAFGYGCGDFLRLQHDIVAVARLIAFHLVVAFDGLACLLIDILPRHPMARRAVEGMEADPIGRASCRERVCQYVYI